MAETSIWKSLALFIFFFSLIIISEYLGSTVVDLPTAIIGLSPSISKNRKHKKWNKALPIHTYIGDVIARKILPVDTKTIVKGNTNKIMRVPIKPLMK